MTATGSQSGLSGGDGPVREYHSDSLGTHKILETAITVPTASVRHVVQRIPLDGSYLFTCAECGEQVDVDAGIREILLHEGCVVCDSEVSRDQFQLLD